jgi:hypothetical protein
VVPVTSADQPTLFAPDPEGSLVKPQGALPVQMRVLITVKAAPNPSETYGETVCVAGIRVDEGHSGWVRLYPINFRELESERTFRKYDIVSLNARPASADPRAESFRPLVDTIRHERTVKGWEKRRPFVIDHVHESMCELLAAVRDRPPFRSLAAIRPRVVQDLEIKLHPGWTPAEQAKIDRYIDQGDLFDQRPRTALEAPRFKGWYRYLCQSRGCKGHRQGIYDWEWVALQRHLTSKDDDHAKTELRRKFLDMICGPDKDTIFYVGNQAKRQQAFMVLGAFYPKR